MHADIEPPMIEPPKYTQTPPPPPPASDAASADAPLVGEIVDLEPESESE
jgi:hypothetical protein